MRRPPPGHYVDVATAGEQFRAFVPAQVLTLFALSNLWMARRQLLPATGSPRL